MDVVSADIPTLLEMEVLDRESLISDTVANRLIKRKLVTHDDGSEAYIDEWFAPTYRARSSHVFVDMMLAARIYYTRAQLCKLHRQFFHHSAEKLFNLLKRSKPDEATPETLQTLKDIAKRFDPC